MYLDIFVLAKLLKLSDWMQSVGKQQFLWLTTNLTSFTVPAGEQHNHKLT